MEKAYSFFKIIITLVIILETAQASAAGTFTYHVQHGDRISDVLWRLNIIPLYGKRGSVLETIRLNPGLINKDGNLIFPSATIQLPDRGNRMPAQEVNVTQTAVVSAPASPVMNQDVQAAAPVTTTTTTTMTTTTTTLKSIAASPVVNPEDQELSSRVDITVDAVYAALEGRQLSNGTRGKLLSKLNKGATLTWSQLWDESWRSKIYLSAQAISFEPTTTGVRLVDSDTDVSRIGVGVAYFLTSRWQILADAITGQYLFYQGIGTASDLKMDKVPLNEMRIGTELKLVRRKALSLSVMAGYSAYTPASYSTYTIQAGSGYDGGLRLSHAFKSSELSCLAFNKVRSQNTSILEYKETQIGAQCGYGWNF